MKATIRGIRRTIGSRPDKKHPATADKVLAMVALAPDSLGGLRDRALLLMGFGGAFRRSELVALDVGDVTECENGLQVFIARAKTDQEGEGVTLGIACGSIACPAKAFRASVDAAGLTDGPLFRPIKKGGRLSSDRLADRAVGSIVKRYADRIGLDAADFSGHSLRSGFITSAAKRGASIFKMMDQSRHKSWTRCGDTFERARYSATMPVREVVTSARPTGLRSAVTRTLQSSFANVLKGGTHR